MRLTDMFMFNYSDKDALYFKKYCYTTEAGLIGISAQNTAKN